MTLPINPSYVFLPIILIPELILASTYVINKSPCFIVSCLTLRQKKEQGQGCVSIAVDKRVEFKDPNYVWRYIYCFYYIWRYIYYIWRYIYYIWRYYLLHLEIYLLHLAVYLLHVAIYLLHLETYLLHPEIYLLHLPRTPLG